MNPSISTSNFYLERVGFEAKLNMRQTLKSGSNVIGRSDTAGVDIGLNSFHCSRKHCMVNVADDSVSVEDLKVSSSIWLPREFLLIFPSFHSHPTVPQLMGRKYRA